MIPRIEVLFLVVLIIAIVVKETIKYLQEKRIEEERLEIQKDVLQKEIDVIYGIIEEELIKGSKTEGEYSMVKETELEIYNTKKLSDLLEVKATEEDYQEALDLILRYVRGLYGEYKFKLLKPQEGDYQSGYALTFTIDHNEENAKNFLETLFKLAVDRGLSEQELSNKFSEAVKDGQVIEPGEAIVSGAGLSSIVSGEPITIFIAYETEEYKEKRLEQEKEQDKQQKEYEAKQEQMQKLREESHKALTEAAVILKEMNKEMVEKNPAYLEAYEKVRELYQ